MSDSKAELIIRKELDLDVNIEITSKHAVDALYALVSNESIYGKHSKLECICSSKYYNVSEPFKGMTLIEYYIKFMLKESIEKRYNYININRFKMGQVAHTYLFHKHTEYITYVEKYIGYLWGNCTDFDSMSLEDFETRKCVLRLYLDCDTGRLNLPPVFEKLIKFSSEKYGYLRNVVNGVPRYAINADCLESDEETLCSMLEDSSPEMEELFEKLDDETINMLLDEPLPKINYTCMDIDKPIYGFQETYYANKGPQEDYKEVKLMYNVQETYYTNEALQKSYERVEPPFNNNCNNNCFTSFQTQDWGNFIMG